MEKTVRLNAMPDSQIQAIGIDALKERLGVVNTLRFLRRFDDGGSGDYTEEKYLNEDVKMTEEEMIKRYL